jgi:hypothetical protein
MIRIIYITLDKTDGSHIHVFSVFEKMMPDVFDAGDVGNRDLLPSYARPSGHSVSKDNLTFHSRVLPGPTNWDEVIADPLKYLDAGGNAVQYHNDANMQAVECDVPSLLNFNNTAATTLGTVVPFRKCGGRISRYCDRSAKVKEAILNVTHLKKHLRNLSTRFMGCDLTQYPEHIGNVQMIAWNPLFRDVDCWIDQQSSCVCLHFLYYDGQHPDMVVRAIGFNQSKALLFDQELCQVHGQKYIDAPLSTVPYLLTLRFYDTNGVMWMDCTTTGRPLSIMGSVMAVGAPARIKTTSKRGKERIIEIQKGSVEHFDISRVSKPQEFLKEEIEHQRFINDEQSLQFVFFDGDRNHQDRNERKATRIVRSIIKKNSNICYICDPYFDYYAFDKFIWPLPDLGREVHIVNCQEFMAYEDKLKESIKCYHQHINHEQVKCHVVTGKGLLHDRFILLDEDGWLIGSSFNEFGKRASTIVKMPQSACVTLRNRVQAWINDSSICKDLFQP